MDTEAQVGQRRFQQDRRGHQQRDVHGDHAHGVGQDVLENNATAGRAGQSSGVDELTLTQRQELAAHESSERRPRRRTDQQTQRNDRGGRRQARGTDVGDGQATQQRGQDDQRDNDDHVGQAHQDGLGPTAEVTGEATDHGPQEAGHHTHHDHHDQGVLRSLHGHGKEVTAQVVLTERMISQPGGQ